MWHRECPLSCMRSFWRNQVPISAEEPLVITINYLDRVVVLLCFLSVIFLHFYHFNQALNILYCENGLHEILKTLKKWGRRRRCISRFGDSNENCHKMDQNTRYCNLGGSATVRIESGLIGHFWLYLISLSLEMCRKWRLQTQCSSYSYLYEVRLDVRNGRPYNRQSSCATQISIFFRMIISH